MKTPVNDGAVAEYAARIRAGIPLGKLFPARMSDCDFTDQQRQVIRQARADRKITFKKANAQLPKAGQADKPTPEARSVAANPIKVQKPETPSKITRMLYLQSGRCFFCGQPLKEEDASIEHLNPKSRGGTNAEDNVVVCHASLNLTFGAMDLKRKFEFVLKSAGSFMCPKK